MLIKIVLLPLMIFSFLLRSLKPKYIGFMGSGLGAFLKLVGFRTKIVTKNLSMALGSEKSANELQLLQTQVYRNIGTQFLEIARNFALTKEDFLEELSISVEMQKKLDKMQAEGRGAVVISAHIANWELFPAGMAARGYRVSIIAKKMSNPISQSLIEGRRQTAGFSVIYTGNTLEKMAEAVKRGEFVGFMVDQHMPGKKGIRVNFFGTPASSIRGLAKLVRETQCAILPMCIFRQPDGTHRLHMLDEVPYVTAPELAEGSAERILREEWLNTQMYQKVIENMIRENLDQWLWIHRRWKADQTPLNEATAHLESSQ